MPACLFFAQAGGPVKINYYNTIMEILFYILAALAGAAVALGIYIPVRRLILNGQKEDIIRKAEIEAENIKKE